MVAISSLKPVKDGPIFINQGNAAKSWFPLFDKIFYFSETDLGWTKKTYREEVWTNLAWVNWTERPTIKKMAELAQHQKEWSCLINADIIVSPRIKQAEDALNRLGANCAFSRRIPVDGFYSVDLGLDFFCAKPEVWRVVAQIIPEQFLIGKQQWDTWLMSFLAHNYPETFYDLSPSKLIYHPNHEDRGDQSIQIEPDKYLQDVRWAKKRLTV